jgi:mRNA interferase RelE/StbE
MTFTIIYSDEAIAEMLALPVETQRQIKKKVAKLAQNMAGNVKILKGTHEHTIYRLRCGDFRVLFRRDGTILVIFSIRNRKEAYE